MTVLAKVDWADAETQDRGGAVRPTSIDQARSLRPSCQGDHLVRLRGVAG